MQKKFKVGDAVSVFDGLIGIVVGDGLKGDYIWIKDALLYRVSFGRNGYAYVSEDCILPAPTPENCSEGELVQ